MLTTTLVLLHQHFPPQNPDHIQLYSMPTPNGQKASIMLEELGMPYDAHLVNITKNEQFHPAFLAVSPNNKIPALLDPDGPGGEPLALFESGAILLYLAEKTGRFLPANTALRYQTIQWLMFQMGGIGPMFGQLGYFHRWAGREIADPRPRERYAVESARLLSVLDQQLVDKTWVMGDEYTIADIAIFPWVNALLEVYAAGDLVEIQKFPQVLRVLEQFLARPAVTRGRNIPSA
jgi:GSH-dependent disulfide-bond oxidoreductase